ncbi:MAG: ABC transporter substrate-binding protein [Christensenellales bacterium]
MGTFVRQMVSKDGTQLEFVPEHAAELPTSEDGGLTWIVKLREGLKWTDGTPIDASIPTSIPSRCRSTRSRRIPVRPTSSSRSWSNAKEYFQGKVTDWSEVGVKVLDQYTLEFDLEYPCTDIDFYTTICEYVNPVKEDLYESLMNADRTSTTYGTTLETSPSCGYYIMTEWVIDGYQMASSIRMIR